MLKVFMWIGWGTLLGAAALATLFVSAFGDEPRTKRAVQRAISPVMVWLAVVVLVGISLINRGKWWTVALAYAMALSAAGRADGADQPEHVVGLARVEGCRKVIHEGTRRFTNRKSVRLHSCPFVLLRGSFALSVLSRPPHACGWWPWTWPLSPRW